MPYSELARGSILAGRFTRWIDRRSDHILRCFSLDCAVSVSQKMLRQKLPILGVSSPIEAMWPQERDTSILTRQFSRLSGSGNPAVVHSRIWLWFKFAHLSSLCIFQSSWQPRCNRSRMRPFSRPFRAGQLWLSSCISCHRIHLYSRKEGLDFARPRNSVIAHLCPDLVT